MASISIRDIAKSFGGVTALQSVSIDVNDGEFLALVGPSGSGKSTLLRIIAGLEEQTTGEIYIGSERVDQRRPKDRDIAMVFQSYALYPHMSVFNNIALPLQMRQLNRMQRIPFLGRFIGDAKQRQSKIAAEVAEAARTLDIERLLERKPGQLSGGQRQRVALGRAIVRHPKVFLMDEPLSNLDAKLRVQMRAELTALHRRLGATFIYVTHDQVEAMTMADRAAVMMDGELLQVAAPQTLYDAPRHLKVAEFIGSPKINVIPGRATSHGEIDAAGVVVPAHLRLQTGADVKLGIRPEALRPAQNGAQGWSGAVVHIERLGSDVFAHVKVQDLSDPLIARFDPHKDSVPSIDDQVVLASIPDRILVFDANGERLSLASLVSEAANG
jgi:multiple sugar transport system ATP-binding protein